MESVFKRLVPRAFYRTTKAFAETVPCRGKRRAERRRALRSDARWQHANEVAAPHRAKIQQRNVELLQRTAEAWARRMAAIRAIFGRAA